MEVIKIEGLSQLPGRFSGPFYTLPETSGGRVFEFRGPYTGKVMWFREVTPEELLQAPKKPAAAKAASDSAKAV